MSNRKYVNPLNYVPLDNTWSPQGDLNPNVISIENYGQNKGCHLYSSGLYQWSAPELTPNVNTFGLTYPSCKNNPNYL